MKRITYILILTFLPLTGWSQLPVNDSLLFWYRSDQFSAGTWVDLNGNQDATPGGGSPTLVSNQLNGYSAVRFNGSTDYLEIDKQINTPQFDIFLVVKILDISEPSFNTMLATNSSEFWCGHENNSRLWQQTRLAGSSSNMYSNYPVTSIYYTINYRYDGRHNEIYVNYGYQGRDTSNYEGHISFPQYIGSRGGTFPAEFDVVEIIWYNQYMNSYDRRAMVDYTNDRYNHIQPLTACINWGQSNQDGRADTVNMTSDVRGVIPSKMWRGTEFETIRADTSINNSHYPQTRREYYGANLSLGKTWNTEEGDTLHQVQYSIGGSSLAEEWNIDSSNYFKQLIYELDTSGGATSVLGYFLDYKFIWFDQGESDAYNEDYANAWKTNCVNITDSIRNRVGMNLPVIGGRPQAPTVGNPQYFPIIRSSFQDLNDSVGYDFHQFNRDKGIYTYKADSVHMAGGVNGVEAYGVDLYHFIYDVLNPPAKIRALYDRNTKKIVIDRVTGKIIIH